MIKKLDLVCQSLTTNACINSKAPFCLKILSIPFLLLILGCNKNSDEKELVTIYHMVRPTEIKPIKIPPIIIPRENWTNIKPDFSKIVPMKPIFRITIHHTASGDDDQLDIKISTSKILQKILLSHKNFKNWADIGYHYIVDEEGKIWEGRNIKYQGAHAGSHEANEGNIGVVLIGNFDLFKPSDLQKKSLIQFIHYLKSEYLIESKNIYGHGYFTGTNCPGKHLSSVVDFLRTEK